MYYVSTRDKSVKLTAAQAIAQGLSRDGGLLTPSELPKLPVDAMEKLSAMSYQERAVYVMELFLDGFSHEELQSFAQSAYGPEKFDDPAVAPVRKVDENTHCLELWHGPTSAFKDMALQMLPHLLSASLTKTEEKRTVCILVATSGDTGKAALEGFRDVDHTKILVFYPKDGVSAIQGLQMQTQEGENVDVCAVYGNFDDAQSGVKQLFSDEKLREDLDQRGYFLSSANSINWGRVLPQLVYYISAYCDLRNSGALGAGDVMNICVPTGNFGNILAAYYAKSMGLPIGKLICASNSNNVLTDFIRTGVYDRKRTFYATMSPSMDILVSSNLERLLFELTERDDVLVASYMESLNADGWYEIRGGLKEKLRESFYAAYCDDVQTQKTIARMWDESKYLIDTHTAVAFDVLEQYRKETGDDTLTVVASTASPFKFCDNVLGALGVTEQAQGVAILDQLSRLTGEKAPEPLSSLKDKKIRFTGSVEKSEMLRVVLDSLQ